MNPMNLHYDTREPGDGEVLVVEDSGTVTSVEDDVCAVYGGNEADYDRAKDDAARIAALLNLARGISTQDLTNGTAVLLVTSAALGERELGGYMAELSSLHERDGFSLSANRSY